MDDKTREYQKDIDALVEEASTCQKVIQHHLTEISRDPFQIDTLKDLIIEQGQKRKAVGVSLGEKLLEWSLLGGAFRLFRPGEEVTVPSAPPPPPSEESTPTIPLPLAPQAAPPAISLLPLPPSDPPQEEEKRTQNTLPSLEAAPVVALSESPPQAPAHLDQIRDFSSLFNSRKTPSVRLPLRTLEGFCEAAGPPFTPDTLLDLSNEVDKLDELTSSLWFDRLLTCSLSDQRLWLSYLVSRFRHVKDLPIVRTAGLHERMSRIILRFPEYTSRNKPGFVHGLSGHHAPVHGTWLRDAEMHWADIQHQFERAPVMKEELPRSDRAIVTERDPESGTEVIEDDWKGYDVTRGKRALLVGGSPREMNRLDIEKKFHFSDFKWVATDNSRQIQSASKQIAKGTYDFVFLLTPIASHATTSAIANACKKSGVPCSHLRGYGVKGIRHAIDATIAARLEELPLALSGVNGPPSLLKEEAPGSA